MIWVNHNRIRAVLLLCILMPPGLGIMISSFLDRRGFKSSVFGLGLLMTAVFLLPLIEVILPQGTIFLVIFILISIFQWFLQITYGVTVRAFNMLLHVIETQDGVIANEPKSKYVLSDTRIHIDLQFEHGYKG